MIKFFFLLPVIMSAIWLWYLNQHNYTLKQGLKGFLYIFSFNAIVIGFFVLMIWLTR